MDLIQGTFKKLIFRPISILILFIAEALYCANLWPSKDEKYVRFIVSCCICFAFLCVYSIIVFSLKRLPKAPKNKLGVLFVFHAETDELFADAKFNIIENFKSVSDKFKISFVPICINANSIKDYSNGNKALMVKLLHKTNCMFSVDIIYQVDNAKNENKYALKINIGTLHPVFDEKQNKFLIGEMNRVAKPITFQKFDREQKLDKLNVTALHLNFAAKYIIALVYILIEDYEISDVLLKDLYEQLPQGENWFFESIKKAYYISCCGMEAYYNKKYVDTKDIKYLDKSEDYLFKMNDMYPNTYPYHLDMSYIQFVKYRNVYKAQQHIMTCKKLAVDDRWVYSDAFLSAYRNENLVVIARKYEKAINTSYNIVDIIEFIEDVLTTEPEKDILHLPLAMLYNATDDTKLSIIHADEFLKSYNYVKLDKYLKKKIDAIKKKRCMGCKIIDCGVCDKTA